ncbi:MAG: 2-oxoadipate dioxygenase/decarboxylase family protein, partial [Planctomycetaceae bacterium]
IGRTVAGHREPPGDDLLARLQRPDDLSSADRSELLDALVDWIHELPWPVPRKQDVLALNKISQYAAWVLVHGYNVNHFTSLINSHGEESLSDIEKTIDALKSAGVPMKAEIEGERGSKLRQTATEAAVIDVPVHDGARETTMPWTYAYFELAERGTVTDPETGREVRFEGFLGPQATNLFEMTRRG